MRLQLKIELDNVFQNGKHCDGDRAGALEETKSSLSRHYLEVESLAHRYLGRGYGNADVERALISFSEKTLPKLLRDFKPLDGRFGNFFETRLKWHCFDYKKLKRNQPTADLASVPAFVLSTDSNNPETALLRQELREIVNDAMRGMRNEDRQVLRWHYFEDFSVKEIAKMLSRDPEATVEEGAVKTRLHRARARLEVILAAKGLTNKYVGGSL
jgi:RNA polymerase sigma factor (sigma-70 family)